jgi:hypothetical protein
MPNHPKRPRHVSVDRQELIPDDASIVRTTTSGFLSLLPVEVIAKVLEWVGDRGFQGSKGLAPARLVSRKWQQAVGELMEKRAERSFYSTSWGGSDSRQSRLALLSLPFMSNTFLERCNKLDLSTTVDDRAVELLSVLPRLGSLLVEGIQLTENGVMACSKLKFVQHLILRGQKALSLADLNGLGEMQELSTLYIRSSGSVAVDGLQALSRCTRLTSLIWEGSCITDAALEAIAGIPSLGTLELEHCRFLTDVGLSHLPKKAANLTRFTLKSIRLITDTGMVSLAGFTNRRFVTRVVKPN